VDFRTVGLIPHASKILLKILARRLESKAELFIGQDQYGLRNGCCTRDAVDAMRVLCEGNVEYNSKVYVCFVDYEKAFDQIDWAKLLDFLGDSCRDRRLIQNLIMARSAYVQVNDGFSEACQIGRGVRCEVCSLCPPLYIIYDEAMMKEATENVQ